MKKSHVIIASVAAAAMLLVTRCGIQFCVRDEKGHTDRMSTLFFWIAAVSYALTMILFVVANKLTTSANAILLQYTCPIYIILLALHLYSLSSCRHLKID